MNEHKGFGRRSRAWAGAAAVGLAVIGVVSGGVGQASRAEALQGRYVALGDSITFGYSPLLEDPWIPERFVGYPEVIAEQSGLTTTNLACPGQTAQALVSRTAVDNGCFDARRAARDAGFALLHTDYSGTQLKAALDAVRSDRSVSLISIQGGGNEISLCMAGTAKPDRCLADALPKVAGSLRQAVTQLRAAGYRGRVVLVGYHLVPGLEAPLRLLNRTIERAARVIGTSPSPMRPSPSSATRSSTRAICAPRGCSSCCLTDRAISTRHGSARDSSPRRAWRGIRERARQRHCVTTGSSVR